jgi:hypothetical protein
VLKQRSDSTKQVLKQRSDSTKQVLKQRSDSTKQVLKQRSDSTKQVLKQRSDSTRQVKAVAACLAMLCSTTAWSGKSCETVVASADSQQRAALAGAALKAELDQSGRDFAIVARIGQDLRKHGLLYSHAGFAHKIDGEWRITHLLNSCGTDDGALFREGLPQFFSDLPLSFQSKVVYVKPDLEDKMLSALQQHSGKALLETRYSIIAKPYSKSRQNSTAWVLETLAAAQNPLADSRKEAQMVLESQNYSPDRLKIAYGKRIAGGLFKANAVFTDHPLSTRLSGNYPVTTVKSIFAHLQKTAQLERAVVLVPQGQLKLAGD